MEKKLFFKERDVNGSIKKEAIFFNQVYLKK